MDHEIEALIGNATLDYALNRIHEASVIIAREVSEEDIDVDEALGHVGMTDQEIDILLEVCENKQRLVPQQGKHYFLLLFRFVHIVCFYLDLYPN